MNAEVPDWIRVLSLLRRKPFSSYDTELLKFLLWQGFIAAEGETQPRLFRITPEGVERLKVYEAINGAVEIEGRAGDRPSPTVGMALSWAIYAAAGKYVSEEQRLAREAICDRCDMVRTDEGGNWCSVCGCGVSANERKIQNLTAYEEMAGHPLCKHPARGAGKGWPLPQLPPEGGTR